MRKWNTNLIDIFSAAKSKSTQWLWIIETPLSRYVTTMHNALKLSIELALQHNAHITGLTPLSLEEDEDLLEAPEDREDLEDFLLLGGGGDIDDLRGPLANSASAKIRKNCQ